MKKQIAILGSTGSIGRQALDVVSWHEDRFEVYALTANTSYEELAQEAMLYHPAAVVIGDERLLEKLRSLLAGFPDIKVYAGSRAIEEIVEAGPVDMVLNALVGFSGVRPTLRAVRARKTVLLANKEALVVAGELICQEVERLHTALLPVDSEHSAIFQCLQGEMAVGNEPERLLLTASGGPFRLLSREDMAKVTASEALKHPTWQMGAKITIDSATMMNKGFEIMEARWLFGIKEDRIDVLVHPESIVHSLVEFQDGAVKAQLGVPDMRLPIQYAMTYPERLPMQADRLSLFDKELHFYKVDEGKFPCLTLAKEALFKGGNMPAVVNGANEVMNAMFRRGECSFYDISRGIERAMRKVPFSRECSLECYEKSDSEARLACLGK